MRTGLSLKPIRHGLIFCSPACGSGCTFKAFQQATRDAKALVKVLGNETWEPQVWENLGWHYKANHRPSKGLLSVSVTGRKMKKLYYHAALSLTAPGAGDYAWHDDKWHLDPRKAVRARLRLVLAYKKRFESALQLVAATL